MSGLAELLETDFKQISSNALYRLSDRLLEHKAGIEARLSARERHLFGLGEKILLYDLTNTYLEGEGGGQRKGPFRSLQGEKKRLSPGHALPGFG